MSLDAYQPCPCGIDKKIKFCCGAEIIEDLGKIEAALDSDQRLGALDLCNRLLAQKPDKPCLLMHKAMVQMALHELGPCRETVEHLLKVATGNPAGLAMAAMLDCQEGKPDDAVKHLQQALESQQGTLIPTVYQAIGIVARTLEVIGEPLAAQAHAAFQAAASQGKDRDAVMTLLEIESGGQIPLAVQGINQLVPAPAEGKLTAKGIADFNEALHQANLGCWLAGAKKFEELAAREANEPAVWRNIGILRTRVLDHQHAIAALRRFTSFASVPRDDAVEAESLAQFLSDPTEVDTLPEMTVTYAVTDASALQEHLLTSKRVQSVPFNPEQFREANEPPPMSAFLLFDREVQATAQPADSITAQNLTRENITKVLGEILLYGKETDRPARVELTSIKTPDFAAKLKHLTDVLGQFAGEKVKEEESGRVSAAAATLAINWRFPDDTPADVRRKMIQEHRAQTLLSIWPNLQMGVLDGRSPRQVVGDPAGQIRVQAIVLQMDLAEPVENPDYNKLRRSLGLPTIEPLDPAGVRVETLSPARQTRLIVEKLSDEQLVAVYRRAVLSAAPRLFRRVGLEVVSRPSLDKHPQIDKGEAYEILSRMALDPDEAVGFLFKAQEAAKAKGRSPARHLLAELPYRLQRGEEQESRRILNLLTTKHAKEPGVAQALYGLLAQLGLMRTDPATGRPVMVIPSAGAPGAAAGEVPMEAAAPAPKSSLWTPDQIAAAAGGEPAPKSKLWLPGMD
jgi:hypothetical protein